MSKIIGTIIGNDDDRVVTVDGQQVSLERSLRVVNHSPTGFCWGYFGSGPAQLALAILLHVTNDEALALRWYQDFKEQFIASRSMNSDFDLDLDVDEWLKERQAKGGDQW